MTSPPDMRLARPDDAPAIEAFLSRHAATSMFLRGNLAAWGIGNTTQPHATTFHIVPAEGPIRGVFGRTNSGMVLCQCPDDPPAIAAYARAFVQQRPTGLTGDAAQIDALIQALGLKDADFSMSHLEPLFHLNLAALPAGPDHVRPPRPEESDLLAGWFSDYLADTGLGSGSAIAEPADRAAAAVKPSSTVRLLDGPKGPVAMAALNAVAGDAVQVGGVFVPAPLRGRGLGRRVTRALLAEARNAGAAQAVLFANNDAAARAYQAIGFSQIGWYRIAFLRAEQ